MTALPGLVLSALPCSLRVRFVRTSPLAAPQSISIPAAICICICLCLYICIVPVGSCRPSDIVMTDIYASQQFTTIDLFAPLPQDTLAIYHSFTTRLRLLFVHGTKGHDILGLRFRCVVVSRRFSSFLVFLTRHCIVACQHHANVGQTKQKLQGRCRALTA